MTEEKRFPIQGDYRRELNEVYGSVPWSVAQVAYDEYHRRYPGQSMERLAERGGFGYWEMTEYTGSEDWKKSFIPNKER